MPSAKPVSDCSAGGRPAGNQKSKSGPRRALVLTLVHALIAAHVAMWARTGRAISPLEPSEAMEFAKHDVVNAGLVFFASTILLTAVFGRFFCGWGCHLVALQDGSRWLLGKLGIRPKPLKSRALLWVPAAAFAYMFLWPLAVRAWVGFQFEPELALTREDFWATFPSWPVALVTFFVCGFAAVYFLGSKGFCTFACPYGAIFGAVDRFAKGRIRVTDACEGCGHCTATCTSNVVVHAEVRDFGMVVDPGCMKCLDCVSVCPKGALYFGFGPAAATASKRGRRWKDFAGFEELALALLFVLAFFSFRGLYGRVPFLLALALAGILASSSLAWARLFYRKECRLAAHTLKRAGKLTRSGRIALALALPVALLWVHSGAVRYQSWRAGELLVSDPERALAHSLRADRWGLLDEPLNRQRLASLSFNAGVAHAGAGRLNEAIERFEAALRVRPDYLEARENLAGMYCGVGRLAEGRALYEQSLRRGEDAETRWFAARACIGMQDFAAADRHLRIALEAAPGSLELWRLAEQAAGALGDSERARACRERIRELEAAPR
jgi:tetratricopeptide (TPR) repeat protein